MVNILVLKTHTKPSIKDTFLLQERRSKKIHGIASIKTYKDDHNNYLIEIKPGIAFPGIKNILDIRSINRKLSLASTFTSELDNVRVKNVSNIAQGQIKKLDGSLIRFDEAKYYVENKGMVDVFDTLISKIGKNIYILTRKNAKLDKQLITTINNS